MSTEYKPLPDLLESYRQGGQLDSEGTITYNSLRAAHLTAKYKFQSPYQYILKFIQAAVLSGATEIEATCRFKRVELRFSSAICDHQVWKHFLSEGAPKQESGTDGVLDLIEAGLTGSLNLNPQRVLITSWDGSLQAGFRHETHRDRVTVQPLSSGPSSSQTQIVIERKYHSHGWQQMSPIWGNTQDMECRDLFDIGHEIKANLDSEFSQVWRRCMFSPVPIILNGLAANRPVFGLPKASAKMLRLPVNSFLRIEPVPTALVLSRSITVLSSRNIANVVPALPHLPQGNSGQRWYLPGSSEPSAPGSTEPGLENPVLINPSDLRPLNSQPLPLMIQKSRMVAAEISMAKDPHLGYRVSGWLCFVRHGVLLEKIPGDQLDLKGWLVVTSADHIGTDLTGFQLVRDRRYDSLIRQIRFLRDDITIPPSRLRDK